MRPIVMMFVVLFCLPLLAQQPLPVLPPMDIDIQETIPATAWDSLYWNATGVDNLVIDNALIYVGGRAGVKTRWAAPNYLFSNWTLRDLVFTQDTNFPPVQGPWGVHAYGAHDWTFSNYYIHDLTRPQDSHGVYTMAYGGQVHENARIVNTWGQGIQAHFNYYDSLLGADAPPIKPFIVRDSELVNNCQGGMGATAVTVRGEQYDQNVLSENNLYWQSFPTAFGWGGWRAKGGFIAYGSHYADPDPTTPVNENPEADGWDRSQYSYRWVVIRGDRYFFDRADRPIIRVDGARYVIIENCHIEEINPQGYGEVYINVPEGRPKPEYVLIRNNTSGAVPVKVRVNGVPVGVVTDHIEIGTPPSEPNPFGTGEPTKEDLIRRIAELDQRIAELAEKVEQAVGKEQELSNEIMILKQHRTVLEDRLEKMQELARQILELAE